MRPVLLISLCFTLLCGAEPDFRGSPGYAAYERANSLFAARKFPESSASIEEALRLDPKLVPALTLKARLAMAAGNHRVAREALSKAVEVAPSSWYAHFMLGFQYYLQNELHLALPSLQRAQRLNPAESQPALYLGLTYESLGDAANAIDCYRQAVRVEESSRRLEPETLLTLARLLLVLDRRDECAKVLDRAVKLNPDYRDSHYERARLLMKQEDFAGAARAAEKALSLPAAGIADRQIRYLLVRAYGLLGDEKKAAEHAAALRNLEAAPVTCGYSCVVAAPR